MYKQSFDMGYRFDRPQETTKALITTQTQRSIVTLHEHSFTETLHLIGKKPELQIRTVNEQFVDEHEYKTIMFTVSSSEFRLVALLHFLPQQQLPSAAWEYLRLERGSTDQQYQDYVCEVGNNFCGVICRILNAANYSTGMSTPAILTNVNIVASLSNIGFDLGTHLAADYEGNTIFCSSICLIVNKGLTINLDIPIPATDAAHEHLGELEFF